MVVLESAIEEGDLIDPRGYAHGGAQTRRLQLRVVIENTGTTPLQNPELIINGLDWRKAPALPAVREGQGDGEWARGVYQFWINHRLHASSGSKMAREPGPMLRFWGYTLCDEDTRSLARTLSTRKIPARQVPLNGHVAGEYFFDGKWNVIDGDQNIVYLALDNRSLASAEEIRRDPFLALRTKPFGRHVEYSLSNAHYNAALFEHLTPGEPKPIKSKELPAAVVSEILHPGEKLVFHFDRAPERPVGGSDLKAWPGARERALGVVEWILRPERRSGTGTEIVFDSSHPITSAVNHTTGETIVPPADAPAFSIAVPVSSPEDSVSVFCQRSRITFPMLRKGANEMLLHGASPGNATVEFVLGSVGAELPKSPPVKAPTLFGDEEPHFDAELPEGADQLWWQIAADPEFSFVQPNFDQVQKPVARVTVDRISGTFFNDGDERFFRAKARANGVWSDWSEPHAFRVRKPAAPRDVAAEIRSDGRVLVKWAGLGAEDFLVFGSNRRDFLPEIYTSEEIVSMRHLQVVQSRPNNNVLAATPAQQVEIAPTVRFLRVVAKTGSAYSPPSPLLELPPAATAGLPPAQVLQVRASKVESPELPNGYRDEYLAEERAYPLVP
jgi:hypothetical protein